MYFTKPLPRTSTSNVDQEPIGEIGVGNFSANIVYILSENDNTYNDVSIVAMGAKPCPLGAIPETGTQTK